MGINFEIINEFNGIRVISDRWRTYQHLPSALPSDIHVPFTRVFGGNMNDLNYPVIWKPKAACGNPASHSLFLLKDQVSLSTIHEDAEGILQRYIPHSGILYKVFVVGGQVEVVMRPSISLEDFHLGENGAHSFDSAFVRKLQPLSTIQKKHAAEVVEHHRSLIMSTSESLSRSLGLRIFGWDLIVGEADEKPYVIDVNNFPKCDGFRDLPDAILSILMINSSCRQ